MFTALKSLLSLFMLIVFYAGLALAEVSSLENPLAAPLLSAAETPAAKIETQPAQSGAKEAPVNSRKEERRKKILEEQEKERLSNREALASEKDPVRRIVLDQEQRKRDLLSKAKIFMEFWNPLDERLALNQAVEEVKSVKEEIAELQNQLDFAYAVYLSDLKEVYAWQNYFKSAFLPPLAPKDDFEPLAEYQQRMAVYEKRVKETVGAENFTKLKSEEADNLSKAKENYLSQEIFLLTPFVERLGLLHKLKFAGVGESGLFVALGGPDAENSRFPVLLRVGEKEMSFWWNYTDRNSAKEFYQTREKLAAERIYQIEEALPPHPKLTAVKIKHSQTGEFKEFELEKPKIFQEIEYLAFLRQQQTSLREELDKSRKNQARLLARKEIARDGYFTVYDDGTVLDARTNLMWAVSDNGEDFNWRQAKSYCEQYAAGGYTDWRMPAQEELAGLYDGSKSYQVAKRHYSVHLTSLVGLSASCLWTSDNREAEAAYYDFIHGKLFWTGMIYSRGYRALPVRANK